MAQTQPQPQPPRGVPPANTVSAARDVVSVACKLPNGLILRGFDERKEVELVLGGGTRDVEVHRPNGDQVVIGGTMARFGDPRPPILTAGGYRITRDVPRALWEQWLNANRNSDLVRNHLVYAHEHHDHVEDWSREHAAAVSGLEGIDPDNPGKRVRGIVRAERPK